MLLFELCGFERAKDLPIEAFGQTASEALACGIPVIQLVF